MRRVLCLLLVFSGIAQFVHAETRPGDPIQLVVSPAACAEAVVEISPHAGSPRLDAWQRRHALLLRHGVFCGKQLSPEGSMTSVNALCWSRCTRRRSFASGEAPKEPHRRSFVRIGVFLVGGDRPATSNPGPLARWPTPAAVLRTGSREANERVRQGRTHPPAHTLADTRSTTAVGSGPPTSASPVRTASGPTIGHSTRPANPRSSCDPPPAHATSAPRRCCPLGSRDARRTTSGRPSVPAGSTAFCVVPGAGAVPPLPLPSGAGKQPRPGASLVPLLEGFAVFTHRQPAVIPMV